MRVLMVAAENAALPGVKVGGIGDVLRDVPITLARHGCDVDVITPGYGFVANRSGAVLHKRLLVEFSGAAETLELYRVSLAGNSSPVQHWVIEHPLLNAREAGKLYCDDPPGDPFATDATRFALFCSGVCEAIAIGAFGPLDIIHLHDWHAALILVLREFWPKYKNLKQIKTVYTIHNVAVQGVRPFRRHRSSLQAWFPELRFDPELLGDPRWPDCINPMAIGIRMADKVHTVSPTYAQEICLPSEVESKGFYGGEGLQDDLIEAREQNRLHGVLNGCNYSYSRSPRPSWSELCKTMDKQVLTWAADAPELQSAAYIAARRIESMASKRPGFIVTSVGRLTAQKVQILLGPTDESITALERILILLRKKGVFILLGTGDVEYERQLRHHSADFANFIFLCGYADHLADKLYTGGDLFLMPSSYEPCGISQMLAMQAGQPCLVHAVGGLKDTVEEGKNGFTFQGKSRIEQSEQLVSAFERAMNQFKDQPSKWKKLRKKASSQRFTWERSVDAYLSDLYS